MAVSFSSFHILAGYVQVTGYAYRLQVTGNRCTRADGMFGLCGRVWAVGGYASPASTPSTADDDTAIDRINRCTISQCVAGVWCLLPEQQYD